MSVLGPALLFDDEVSFIGHVDQRDIIKVEFYQGNQKIKDVKNRRFIKD